MVGAHVPPPPGMHPRTPKSVECTYEINDKRFEQVIQGQRVKRIKTGPLPEIFLSLTVMVDVEQTADVTETAYFNFTDTDEHIIVKVNELQLILNIQPICACIKCLILM